jgi:hypothetical protein
MGDDVTRYTKSVTKPVLSEWIAIMCSFGRGKIGKKSEAVYGYRKRKWQRVTNWNVRHASRAWEWTNVFGRGRELTFEILIIQSRSMIVTYDHRHQRTRDPVRSPLVKLVTGRLVVGSVTTSEHRLLYVFAFLPTFCSSVLDLIECNQACKDKCTNMKCRLDQWPDRLLRSE